MDTHNNLYSFCYWALQSISSYWYTRYWCFGFARKAFLSIIFLVIKIHLWNQTNMDTCNNCYSFCYWALQSCSSHWDTRYWCFGLAIKAFSPPFSVQSKFICQMRQTWILKIIFILFVVGHYNHFILIVVHNIDALVWQEKLSFPPFSL